MLRMTVKTPVKLQINKFQAKKACQVGFNLLQQLYSRAFVKRIRSFVHVNGSYYVIACRSQSPMSQFD
jgi:hypothetical protein